MCNVVEKNTEDLVHTSMSRELTKLEIIVGLVHNLTPNQSAQEPITNSDNGSVIIPQTQVLDSESISSSLKMMQI